MTCSSGTNPALRHRHPARPVGGHLEAHEALPPPAPSRPVIARLRPRPLMKGKGCSASTASGVRMGQDGALEVARAAPRAAPALRSRVVEDGDAGGARAPAGSPRRMTAGERVDLPPDLLAAGGELLVGRPAVERALLPPRLRIWRFRPLIRFMKNSSWSMPMMPTNLTRSSSGRLGGPRRAPARAARRRASSARG